MGKVGKITMERASLAFLATPSFFCSIGGGPGSQTAVCALVNILPTNFQQRSLLEMPVFYLSLEIDLDKKLAVTGS